jgi:hypothetical protein
VKSSGIQELDRALDHNTADMPSDAAIDYHSVDPVIVGISVDVLLHLKEAAILLSYEHVLTSLQTTWAGVVYGLLSEEQAFDITEQAQVTQR